MPKYLLFVVACGGLMLRLAYAATTGSLHNPQYWEQERIATNLVERHVFLFDPSPQVRDLSYAEPLYPFMAAGVYLLTDHSRTALVILQLLIAAATVWMCGYAAWLSTGNATITVAAAALLAVHPGAIRYSSVLHPFILDSFFFVAAAAALVHYRHEPDLRRGSLAAATIGIGALTRPTILVMLSCLCWLAWRSRDSLAVAVRRSALLVVLALAFVAPWTTRNAIVHHTFMLTRSGTGLVFWLGNNPNGVGAATDIDGTAVVKKAPLEFRARVRAADELTRDRIYHDAAVAYIRAHPVAAAVRVIRRLYYFWWFSPAWGKAFSPTARLVYRTWWAGLLVLIAVGFVVTLRTRARHDLWMLAGLATLISLVQAFYYVEGRHRLAIEPLVLPLAAAGLLAVVKRKSTTADRPSLE